MVTDTITPVLTPVADTIGPSPPAVTETLAPVPDAITPPVEVWEPPVSAAPDAATGGTGGPTFPSTPAAEEPPAAHTQPVDGHATSPAVGGADTGPVSAARSAGLVPTAPGVPSGLIAAADVGPAEIGVPAAATDPAQAGPSAGRSPVVGTGGGVSSLIDLAVPRDQESAADAALAGPASASDEPELPGAPAGGGAFFAPSAGPSTALYTILLALAALALLRFDRLQMRSVQWRCAAFLGLLERPG
jgi:hypothetical protein